MCLAEAVVETRTLIIHKMNHEYIMAKICATYLPSPIQSARERRTHSPHQGLVEINFNEVESRSKSSCDFMSA